MLAVGETEHLPPVGALAAEDVIGMCAPVVEDPVSAAEGAQEEGARVEQDDPALHLVVAVLVDLQHCWDEKKIRS